jgi:dephospho-CoA kinase
MAGKKPVIGILGGICSGKSTVAEEFALLGCKVINADIIAHELLAKKIVKDKIIRLFGRTVLYSNGKIDRGRLAEIVFADGDKLSMLNGVIHPYVLRRTEGLIKQYNCQKTLKAIILDMPLLVEVGWAKRCDRLIFVKCSPKIRYERAKKIGLNKKQLKIRENFQISLDNKERIADNIIENNSDFSTLVSQIADIFSSIV